MASVGASHAARERDRGDTVSDEELTVRCS